MGRDYQMTQQPPHQPVLLTKALEFLGLSPKESYLDLTAGYGGHAQAAAQIIGLERMVLVDRDSQSVAYLQKCLSGARIIHSDFASATEKLARQKEKFDSIIMDLGVASPHFDRGERGFSLVRNGPLDMRMDQRQNLTAAEIVNSYPEAELAELIQNYGEDRKARLIARQIVAARPIETTEQLAQVVLKAFRRYQYPHPAARTFQALRMAVNDEIGQLQTTLPRLPELLNAGGRLVIISFHSLEDRLIKNFIKQTQELINLTPKVVKGSEFDSSNRRARSAKLRAAIKK
jgi:16S rRNA (cytosine1402-N4)-methyltransferase